MAITRRQFVTRLGTAAAAMGLSQTNLAQIAEVFAHKAPLHGTLGKPKVIWVHGAECTGCSTSLLGLFEDARGGTGISAAPTTADALTTIVDTGAGETLAGSILGPPLGKGHRTLEAAGFNVDGNANAINIADIVIDWIDLQYHETIQSPVGDLAYTYLDQQMNGAEDGTPYLLVVEGAIQPKDASGYWNTAPGAPWCSIAANGEKNATGELSFDDVVADLASRADCVNVVAIGQCASYGGYPGCKGPDLPSSKSQTGAVGTYDFLKAAFPLDSSIAGKVVNVPGCPANPWWFVLTAVAWMAAVTNPSLASTLLAMDPYRRLKAVYPSVLHSKYCPRYPKYASRIFASYPGDPNGGCLKNVGCKGMATKTLCGSHGWNGQQPQNRLGSAAEGAILSNSTAYGPVQLGGNCIMGGHPCMGCTEKGYPDAMVPFVIR